MDSRGGCCIARYTGGGGDGGAYDLSKMDRIMLKFRPIAPKPSVGGGSVCLKENEVCSVVGGRGKRKYVNNTDGSSGVSKRGCGRKRKASSPEKSERLPSQAVVTLPLLPETPGKMESPVRSSVIEPIHAGVANRAPIWLGFGPQHVETDGGEHVVSFGHGEMITPPRMVEGVMVVVTSWLKVECVTDTWVDAYGLGRTDEERLMNLHKDTCPGLLSNTENQVTWANQSYKEMIGCGGGESERVQVSVGIKDGLRLLLHKYPAAFTCRVKVFTCKNDKIRNKTTTSSLTLPCDVWRMDNGGFAWRLDTKAALSLGR